MAQFVFLVHHADAIAGGDDSHRPLSALGMRQAESVAAQARARGATPTAIWHSGKLRARQTAEFWLRLVNPAAEFVEMPGITPDDDPDTLAVALAAERRDIAVTSHMPLLPTLLHRLVTGRRDLRSATFPLNGCVALERDGDAWREVWRLIARGV